MNISKFSISQKLLPNRLDLLLTNISGKTRSSIQNLIKKGKVSVNSEIITECKFCVDYECEIYLDNSSEFILGNKIEAKKIDIDIVFEDEDIIVINKQSGLTVHPGNGNHNDTLVNALKYMYEDNLSSLGGDERAGIVHRLDRYTTGLMIIAKNDSSHSFIANQIQNRSLKRYYKAIVHGVPTPTESIIETNIGRSDRDRTKMTVLKHGGKNAITEYRVKEIYCNSLFSLVECRLQTGRTHQIRVHMDYIKNPVLGDNTYGCNDRKIKKIQDNLLKEYLSKVKRQLLHAYYIKFIHPKTEKEIELEIDLPDDMKLLIKNLIEYSK